MAEDNTSVRLVIISGLSGSGKSCAIKCFEDLGFFCIDNLPPQLLPKFVRLCRDSRNKIPKAAIGIDIRERDFLRHFLNVYDGLIKDGAQVELLYLQAQNEILQRRFSETRRPHPLDKEGNLIEGIERERKILKDLRKRADKVIDTSEYHVHQLKEVIQSFYLQEGNDIYFKVSLTSFGYKHGTPSDLDLLFDVRFLSNPYFVEGLRPLTGNDLDVQNYISSLPETKCFLEKLYGLIDFLLPLYKKEGKRYLTIGFGCTGGRHRSVTIVNLIKAYMRCKGISVLVTHRDIDLPD
ncbi:MAG: RNase adapter RapZ [Nitrospiria bacterium]